MHDCFFDFFFVTIYSKFIFDAYNQILLINIHVLGALIGTKRGGNAAEGGGRGTHAANVLVENFK